MEELPRKSDVGKLPGLVGPWSNERMQSSNASDSIGSMDQGTENRTDRRELDRELGRALSDALSDILAAEKPRARKN